MTTPDAAESANPANPADSGDSLNEPTLASLITPPAPLPLAGRVALVTGAGAPRLGRAIALAAKDMAR